MSFLGPPVGRLRTTAVWVVFLAEMGTLVVLISSLYPVLKAYLAATKLISWLYRVASLVLRGFIWLLVKLWLRGASKKAARPQPGSAGDHLHQPPVLLHYRAAPLVNILPGLARIDPPPASPPSDLSPEGEVRLQLGRPDAAATRLDTSTSEIRLARVVDVPLTSEGEASSSSSPSPLRLELSVVSLDGEGQDSPEFLAICHAPGESTTITVDRRRTEAPRGLVDALVTSHGVLGGREGAPAYIWAGEVCVNGHDPAERDSQSLLVPRIYQRAKKVIVWLPGGGGPAQDNQARCLFAFVRVWSGTLVESKEWTGSSEPGPPLLSMLDEVMRTAWETWDEPMVSVSTSPVGHRHAATPPPAAAAAAAADHDQADTGHRVEGGGEPELYPITSLLAMFGRHPYWSHPQGFRHSCDPKNCIILGGKGDIVIGLVEVSRVFLWISNFGRDIVAGGQRPECISAEVWDILNVLVVEVPRLPIFQHLVVQEDRRG